MSVKVTTAVGSPSDILYVNIVYIVNIQDKVTCFKKISRPMGHPYHVPKE